MEDRHAQMLAALEAARGPLSGPELAERLQVSTRSIRQYVREVNHRAGGELVRATHRGYDLDRPALEEWRQRRGRRTARYDTPQQRLYFVVRQLVTNSSSGTDVFELGDLLNVSPSTIENDLGKARELFRDFGLRVRRERDLLYLDGSERDQRRLVRQVLLQSGQGMTSTVMQGFADEFSEYDVRALSQAIQQDLAGTDSDVDEYALHDIVIHLTIAADRVRRGHQLAAPELPENAEGGGQDPITGRIVDDVDRVYGVRLPPGEAAILSVMLRARARRRGPGLDAAVNPESLRLVRDAMRELSAAYLLEFYDEGTLVDLALHART